MFSCARASSPRRQPRGGRPGWRQARRPEALAVAESPTSGPRPCWGVSPLRGHRRVPPARDQPRANSFLTKASHRVRLPLRPSRDPRPRRRARGSCRTCGPTPADTTHGGERGGDGPDGAGQRRPGGRGAGPRKAAPRGSAAAPVGAGVPALRDAEGDR